jgi:hypothetical protein
MAINPAYAGLAAAAQRVVAQRKAMPGAPVAPQPPAAPKPQLPSTQQVGSMLANQGVGSVHDVAKAKNLFVAGIADPNGTYANPNARAGWAAPTAGAVGPGGAVWGGGGGGENRYDYEAEGSGLWSIGIDPADPQAINKAISWYKSQDPGTRAELGSTGGKSMNDPAGFLRTIDARQREVARKIQKPSGFFNSTFGKILGTVAPIALGFIPGIGTAAQIGLGAALGGAQGGIKGALLGGAASAIGPSIRLPGGVGGVIKAPVAAAKSAISQLAKPQALAQLAASKGLGAAVPRRAA